MVTFILRLHHSRVRTSSLTTRRAVSNESARRSNKSAGRNNKSARRNDETLDKSDATPSANNAFDLVQCGIPAQHKVIVHHQT